MELFLPMRFCLSLKNDNRCFVVAPENKLTGKDKHKKSIGAHTERNPYRIKVSLF